MEKHGMPKYLSSRFNKCLHFVKIASDIFKEIKCCTYNYTPTSPFHFPPSSPRGNHCPQVSTAFLRL